MAQSAKFFSTIIFPNPETVSLDSIFENYRYQVIADKVGGKNFTLAIDVETDEDITLELRNGVLVLHDGVTENADVVIKTSRADLNPILSGKATWSDASFETTGDKDLATSFWTYFDSNIFADHISVR